MSTHRRTKHGRAMRQVNPIPGTEHARAGDVISMLSGVNAKQVLRVLAAIEVIRRTTMLPVSSLIETQDVPMDRVEFSENQTDEENTRRAESADALLYHIVRDGQVGELEYILRTARRFT